MPKKHNVLLVLLSAVILLGASPSFAQTALTVDNTHVGQPFRREMLGVGFGNWEFGWFNKPMLGDPVYAPLAAAYKKSNISVLRYAGGNWNEGLFFDRQPHKQRGTYSYRGNTYYQNYGTDELQGLYNFSQNAGAEVMIEVNIFKNDPAMWADMVKYTNVEHNWKFKYWEIGNENEATWNSSYLTPDEYMNRFIEYEKAMKAVDPSIIVIGPTDASPVNVSNGQGKLNREIVEMPGKLKAATGRDQGGISWHWYDGYQDNTIGNIFRYTGPDGSGFNGNNNWSRSYGDTVPSAIENQVIKGGPILQVVSEINTLADNRAHISQNHISGLFLSDALPRLASNGVDMANIWVGYGEVGSSFAMIQHSGFGANMRLNSPYYVYYMLSEYFGDQLIGSAPLTNERISIWASRDSADPGKLKLIITNFSDSSTAATVSVNGFTVGSGQYYELLPDGNLPGWNSSGDVDVYSTLNGKKLDIYNLNASAAAITPNTLTVSGNGFTRTFPKYSVTSVILSGTSTQPSVIPPSPTTVVASPTTAPTTNPSVTANPVSPTVPNPTGATSPPVNCPRKPEGDANCDGNVNLQDLEIWTREYLEDIKTTQADFNGGGTCKTKAGTQKTVCLDDLQIWTTTYLLGSRPQANTTISATPSPAVSVTTAPVISGSASSFLQTQGKDIMYKGSKVLLKGTNFDNIDTLGADIGSDDMTKISFTEADYAELNKHGGNHVRLGLSFSWYLQNKTLFYQKMDEQVAWAKKHHIWLVFNMFTTPGDCYEGYGNTCGFWGNQTEKNQLKAFWVEMATRYKDNPTVAGYDILNEPTPATDCKEWFPIAGNIEAAIHGVSPNQLVFIETCSDPANDLKYNSPPKGKNIVYEVHDYSPMGMSHHFKSPYATYPGRSTEWFSEDYTPKGCYYDANSFKGVTKSGDDPKCGDYMDVAENYGINWANENNVPIYIGEWGSTSLLNGYPQYHKDKAELYNALGVSHAHYTWKHQTIKTGGEYQWGIYSRPLNLDDPDKLNAVKISWQGAVQPD
jgi:alpha-L-arabinofuranosidase